MLKKRRGAAMLIEVWLLCLIFTLLAISVAELRSAYFTTLHAADIDLEAKCIAVNQANLLYETPYEEIMSVKRTVADENYSYELIADKEAGNSKPVTINVYQGKKTDARYVMKIKVARRSDE